MAGDDQLLVKIAVFGMVMSVMCTALIGVLFISGNGDYDYDEVQAYRGDLVSFSGETMLNHTPWILTAVYTPWEAGMDPAEHTDPDGWLYGESVQYPDIGKSADIHLDKYKKSSTKLGYVRDAVTYQTVTGTTLGNSYLSKLEGIILGLVGVDTRTYADVTVDNWNYTGYRYVFDPTLPFSEEDGMRTSARDGALSLVWYQTDGTQGLSGGLDVYGGDVKLASYSSADIIADYDRSSGYASHYDFEFDGVSLQLSVRFDPEAVIGGMSLAEAWTMGYWSMAISSVSAGNFFDINNSTSFTATAGNMIQTFIQIYTFDVPSINNPWMEVILWLMVGLPMTIAMLCVTLRLVNGFRVL